MNLIDTGKLIAQGKTMPVPPAFRALRHRNFRLWFFGQGLSLIGTWMQTMAEQVLVYRLTGSAVALGIVTFMTAVPLVPMALWGGSLSDRLPKRTLILCTQTAMMIQAFVLGTLAWTGVVQAWHVYVMAFLLGAVRAMDMPPRQSFIVEMVEGKEDLQNAIGLNSTIVHSGRTLGPALAGIAVATMGEAMAFYLNGLSFVAVIVSLIMMRDLPRPTVKEKSISVLQHTAEGVRFLLSQQTLLVIMSMVAVSSFLSMPYSTLMPVFANQVLKESAAPVVTFLCGGTNPIMHCEAPEALPLGMLLTALGVGSVAGALLVASLPQRIRRGQALTIGNLGFPLLLLGLSISRSLALSMALIVLVGITFVMQQALANTLLQITVPDKLRGRVMSLYSLTFQGMMNVGGLQAGFAADMIGAPLSVGIGAGISLAYGAWVAIRYPQVRRMS